MRGAAGSETSDDDFGLAEHLSFGELIALAEAFGGTRLYIPKQITGGHRIAGVIGLVAGVKLAALFGGDVVRIPLMREDRARHHRAEGRSHAWIARHLCMTETGVEKMLKRKPEASSP